MIPQGRKRPADDKIFNPATGRFVSIDGRVGRKLLRGMSNANRQAVLSNYQQRVNNRRRRTDEPYLFHSGGPKLTNLPNNVLAHVASHLKTSNIVRLGASGRSVHRAVKNMPANRLTKGVAAIRKAKAAITSDVNEFVSDHIRKHMQRYLALSRSRDAWMRRDDTHEWRYGGTWLLRSWILRKTIRKPSHHLFNIFIDRVTTVLHWIGPENIWELEIKVYLGAKQCKFDFGVEEENGSVVLRSLIRNNLLEEELVRCSAGLASAIKTYNKNPIAATGHKISYRPSDAPFSYRPNYNYNSNN